MSSFLKALKIKKTLVYDYVGDGNANREIDLGDDYNFILIMRYNNVGVQDTSYLGYAVGTCYGAFQGSLSYHAAQCLHLASANGNWQGKMSGADKNKIKLSSTTLGLNESGGDYRILGIKFRS